MLRLSKLTDYAIVVMSAMTGDQSRVHSASELAATTKLEQPTVAKVLKGLAKSGLIKSYRGVRGGYALAAPPERVSVADIITAMEGPIGVTECSAHVGLCTQEAVCALRTNWQRISRAIEIALSEVSLRDMTRPMVPPIDVKRMRLVALNKAE